MNKVITFVYKLPLTTEEIISLDCIRSTFISRKITFVVPRSLNVVSILRSGESIERFDDKFFTGIIGYNQLLTSSLFYERFSDYNCVLICQLDCLVFRDELDAWSNKKLDYIAAPWFRKFREDPAGGLWRVGNGGFSLRNVVAHLRVLRQRAIRGSIYPKYGGEPWTPTSLESERGLYRNIVPWYRRMNPFAKWGAVEEELLSYQYNEDLFWSLEAPKFDPSFRIASAEEALPFAFEMAPQWCFKMNGNKLPFGCHAWGRYDRDFWLGKLSSC